MPFCRPTGRPLLLRRCLTICSRARKRPGWNGCGGSGDDAEQARDQARERYEKARAEAREKYQVMREGGDEVFRQGGETTNEARTLQLEEAETTLRDAEELKESNADYQRWLDRMEGENLEVSQDIDYRRVAMEQDTESLESRLEARAVELFPWAQNEVRTRLAEQDATLTQRRAGLQSQLQSIDAATTPLQGDITKLSQTHADAESLAYAAELKLKDLETTSQLCREGLDTLIAGMHTIESEATGLGNSTSVSGLAQRMQTLLDAYPEQCRQRQAG